MWPPSWKLWSAFVVNPMHSWDNFSCQVRASSAAHKGLSQGTNQYYIYIHSTIITILLSGDYFESLVLESSAKPSLGCRTENPGLLWQKKYVLQTLAPRIRLRSRQSPHSASRRYVLRPGTEPDIRALSAIKQQWSLNTFTPKNLVI